MNNPITNYRGYTIECDDEFGYIVIDGCREFEQEFGTKREAQDFIDALVDDVAEARRLGF